MNAIAIAIENYGAGQAGIARLLGVTPQAVNQWVTSSRSVPPRHVLAIETATGVSRHDLRPDVFGPAPANPAGEVADAA
ncbi:transcriptional regulator [Xanthomonas citri]|uniref:transcriptional regulator n=1 Tax=Xanthomonas citri TaxID=346 RepID=UPI0005376E9F|nr:YdaS family helix-turn-helix protein [Xanthomonas citri]